MTDAIARIDAYLERTQAERLDELFDFLRIPTVGVLSAHAGDVRRGANWIAECLRKIGLEHVDVSETGGYPVVYADWLHADDSPTVIAYAHYDVQPVDPLELWARPPFEPRLEGGRIFGLERPTTRANSTSTSGLPVPGSRPPGACPSTSASSSRARRRPARLISRLGSRPTRLGSTPTSSSSATPASTRATTRP
jgi:hypothetical protein